MSRYAAFYWPTGGGSGQYCGCQDNAAGCRKEECTCVKAMCECDKSKDGTHTDDGYVTDMNKLPVQGIALGGVGRYSGRGKLVEVIHSCKL